MKYKNYITIDVADLEQALRFQYGDEFIDGPEIQGHLRQFIAGECYSNDCYVSFWCEETEGESDCSIANNVIVNYLLDTLPIKYGDKILINISW